MHGWNAEMADTIEKIGNSTIQHGPENDRIYLMDLAPEDFPRLLDRIDEIRSREKYTKIFGITPVTLFEEFKARGYRIEARVPGFYTGKTEGLFIARFHSTAREIAPENTINELKGILNSDTGTTHGTLPEECTLSLMTEQDIPCMCRLFSEVFPQYPFPVHDKDFIRKTMAKKTRYHGIHIQGNLAAIASAEINYRARSAEMTDFAVMPEYRGNSLGQHLLQALEKDARENGIITAYTIARLKSTGMNIVFRRGGYTFTGTLVNNTRISRGIESMNVWYKSLQGRSCTPKAS